MSIVPEARRLVDFRVGHLEREGGNSRGCEPCSCVCVNVRTIYSNASIEDWWGGRWRPRVRSAEECGKRERYTTRVTYMFLGHAIELILEKLISA